MHSRQIIPLWSIVAVAVIVLSLDTRVRADDDEQPIGRRRVSCRQSFRLCRRDPSLNDGPVCGMDDRTYSSYCQLTFVACKRLSIVGPRLGYRGPCMDDAYFNAVNSVDDQETDEDQGEISREETETEENGDDHDHDESEEDVSQEDEEEEGGGETGDEEAETGNGGPSVGVMPTTASVSAAVTSITSVTSTQATPRGSSSAFPMQPEPTTHTSAETTHQNTETRTPVPRATDEPTTVQPTCAPTCPLDNSNPVCGTDGETYNSLCLLEAQACITGDPSLVVLHDGACVGPNPIIPLIHPDPTTLFTRGGSASTTTRTPEAAPDDRPVRERLSYCPRSETECSLLYLPVCGSDGHTYISWCHLRLVACSGELGNRGDSLTVDHMGECREDTIEGCKESCPDLYEPVCGSDNMTYYSICSMRRIACLRGENDPSVRHNGECQLPPLACPEYCPGVNDPVCGTNGNSYPSLCIIRLVACRSSDDQEKQLRVAYRGLCINEPCQNSCPEREYVPLCGSNGQTYQNECFLWLEMCRNPDLVRFDKDCNLAIP